MMEECNLNNSLSLFNDCFNCNDKLCEYYICLIVGSRTFNDYEFLKSKMNEFLANYSKILIVSGGANGADKLAEQYAKEYNYRLKVFLANWDIYDKQAGYIRNEEMHKYISKFVNRGVYAFWDGISKGTAHNFSLAKKYNNPIQIINV